MMRVTGNLLERKVGRNGISNKRKDLSRFLVWLNLDKIKRQRRRRCDAIMIIKLHTQVTNVGLTNVS